MTTKLELPTATVAEQDGLRTLHLGDTPWVQGAMLVRQPRVIVLEYVQRMMAWMLWRDSADVTAGHAVQFGLGAGSITRFCHQVLQMNRATVMGFFISALGWPMACWRIVTATCAKSSLRVP